MRTKCRECGEARELHDGLCWSCREREGSAAASARGPREQAPDVEPAHDQPWVPTNQLADKVRRSPRE